MRHFLAAFYVVAGMCVLTSFLFKSAPNSQLDNHEIGKVFDVNPQDVQQVKGVKNLRFFTLKLPPCDKPAFVFVTEYAARANLRSLVEHLNMPTVDFYAGAQVADLNEHTLIVGYILQQLKLKFGLRREDLASVLLIAVAQNPECSPLAERDVRHFASLLSKF